MATSVQDIFTKTLPEDAVQYEIFIGKADNQSEHEGTLEEYKIKCLALATSLSCDYIWNNEGFNLCAAKSSDGNISCLQGMTNFGDFIEDEWFIVWILFQISSNYKELVCRIRDNDGEFLLIEAADVLPRWLNPDTAKNRVFIHNGTLHIIPIPQTPGDIISLPTGAPTTHEALKIIWEHPGLTQAHINVKQRIEKRTDGFPQKAMDNVQKVNMYVPELIVKILDQEPNLVSAAVRAFYYRDPIDLKSCRVFKHFLPNARAWCQVSMNRCSYAQLMQQVFQADRRSGYVVPKNAGGDYKGMDLGSKLTHGFEILCSTYPKGSDDGRQAKDFDDVAFQKYVAALHKRDYFHGEIQGSKRYKELLANAKVYFSRCMNDSLENDRSISGSAGRQIKNILDEVEHNTIALRRLSTAPCRLDLPEESGDEWMYLDDHKMEEVLSDMKNGFEKLSHKKCDITNSEQAEVSDLGEKMQQFVTKLSSYEGVEVPSVADPINFDEDSFSTALSKIFGPMGELNTNDESDSLSDDFLSSESESEPDSEGEGVRAAMEQMDMELASTNVGKSFVKEVSRPNTLANGDLTNGVDSSDSDGGVGEFKPVNLDLNLVQNFLESCSSELDLPGPATNLLQSVGLNVDRS